MSTDRIPDRRGPLARRVDRLGLRSEPDDARIARERRDWWEPQLQHAVAILAADADAQRRWLLERFDGQTPGDADELAFHFDGLWMEGRIQHAIEISPRARQRLDELDRALDAMSGPENAALWTLDALVQRPEWARVRRLATVSGEALRREFDGRSTRDIGQR